MIVESTPSPGAPKAHLRQHQPHRGETRQYEPWAMIADLCELAFRTGAASIAIVTMTVFA